MKNITVFVVLVIIVNSAFGQETGLSFSAAVQSGFVRGQALELVYPVPGDTKGELLSELKWDMKNVYYLGIQADYSRSDLLNIPGLSSSLSFKIGIPSDSGFLENRDWMSTENSDLTHFSKHTNKTRQFFWLDAAVGRSFPVKSLFYLKPFLSGSWMHFAWTGRDGYGIYARGKTFDNFNNPLTFFPIDDNPRNESFAGREVIRYKQDWFIIAAGLSAGTRIFSSLFFDLSFQISPLTFCNARDDHLFILVTDTYLDRMWFGLFFESSASLSYSLRRFDISFEWTWRHIGETKGNTQKSINNSDFYKIASKAGAGLSLVDLRLLFKIRL